MGKYTVISDVSSGLVNLLSSSLVPEIIPNKNQIFLGNPKDNPRASLCIYLYNVREERGIQANNMISQGIDRQRYPSVYLTLNYMITPLSSSEGKFRALEEQKLLGRVIQIFNEFSVLDDKDFEPAQNNHPTNIKISLEEIEQDDQFKVFQSQDMPYKVSLFYRVSPVELISTKEREITRVSEYKINYVYGDGR